MSNLYLVPREGEGALFMMPAPGTKSTLADHLLSLRVAEISHVMSLLETEESQALGLQGEAEQIMNLGMAFDQFSIKDFDVPEDLQQFLWWLEQLRFRLKKGARIAIHCHGGRGRSSLLAIGLLYTEGLSLDQARARVSEARGCAVPETEAQWTWLEKNLPNRD